MKTACKYPSHSAFQMASARQRHCPRGTTAEPDRTCRLTGFAAFTGIGTYAIYEARKQGTFATTRPPGGARVAGKVQAVVGLGTCHRIHQILLALLAPAPEHERRE